MPTSTTSQGTLLSFQHPELPPDKPLPITPLSTTSSTLISVSALDSPSVRDSLDTPPHSATPSSKVTANGTSKQTHALLELIESERAYASDLVLIRDIHLPPSVCVFILPHILVISDEYFQGHEPPIPTPPPSIILVVPPNALYSLGFVHHVTWPPYDTQ